MQIGNKQIMKNRESVSWNLFGYFDIFQSPKAKNNPKKVFSVFIY